MPEQVQTGLVENQAAQQVQPVEGVVPSESPEKPKATDQERKDELAFIKGEYQALLADLKKTDPLYYEDWRNQRHDQRTQPEQPESVTAMTPAPGQEVPGSPQEEFSDDPVFARLAAKIDRLERAMTEREQERDRRERANVEVAKWRDEATTSIGRVQAFIDKHQIPEEVWKQAQTEVINDLGLDPKLGLGYPTRFSRAVAEKLTYWLSMQKRGLLPEANTAVQSQQVALIQQPTVAPAGQMAAKEKSLNDQLADEIAPSEVYVPRTG